MGKKEIYLKIDTYDGVITIPFKNLEEVDKFTVMYSNMAELINSLIRILNLKIDLYDVSSVYLTRDKYKREIDTDCLPVKYSSDNFNYQSLHDAFVAYINADLGRILSTDLRYLRTREIAKFFDSRYIDPYEVDRAVRSFFDGTGYKRKRDTYFMIRDEEGVKIKIDKVEIKRSTGRKNLSQYYDEKEDNYLNYLIELSQRRPDMFEKVLEEIAQSDLEDISKFIKDDGYGIVDGVSDVSILTGEQIKLLEETTGISIDELREKHTSFGRKRRPR